MVELYRKLLEWEYGMNYKLAPLAVTTIVFMIGFSVYKRVKSRNKVLRWEKDLETRKEIIKTAKEEKTGMFSDNNKEGK